VTDVERIASFIRTVAETEPGRTVVLAGFTDSVGDFAANKALSQARAEQARGDLMRAFGSDVPRTPVVARGYSKLLPTSCNTTAEGRTRNRRVEIWLK
jgi:phosphate transport system substrate-binding protein